MRTTRFMTWFFLTLSLAFLCVQSFRPALEAPLALFLPGPWTSDYGAAGMAQSISSDFDVRSWQTNLLNLGTGRILERFFTLRRYVTPTALLDMAHQAERSGDAEFMAFAALHLPDAAMHGDAVRLADEAVAKDPRLTWLYCQIGSVDLDAASNQQLLSRIDKTIAWDPDNIVPHVVRANLLLTEAEQAQKADAGKQANLPAALAKRLEWQKEMETAFARTTWEPYQFQRIDLERRVMVAHGWTDALVLAYTLESGIPSFLSVRNYTKLLVDEMGKNAEAAGNVDDALKDYRTAARFGELLRLQGHTEIEDLIGISVQRPAYAHLLPALNKAGKDDEAAAIEFAQKEMMSDLNRYANPVGHTSNHTWAVLLAGVAAMGVWVFLFLSAASLLYVNARQSIRPEKRGRVYEAMTTLENYAPIMLFASCLVLALVYAPFAENLSSYMAAKASQVQWDQLRENTFPSPQIILRTDLPIENPYPGFALYTFAIAAVLTAIAIVRHRLGARKETLLTTPAPATLPDAPGSST